MFFLQGRTGDNMFFLFTVLMRDFRYLAAAYKSLGLTLYMQRDAFPGQDDKYDCRFS